MSKQKKSRRTDGECDSVLPWEIPSSGVLLKMEICSVRPVQPGSWLMVHAVLILVNLRDQSRPMLSLSVLQSGQKSFAAGWRMIIENYVVFIRVHFALRGNAASARKVLPHRFNALLILVLHKCFLILAIIYFFTFQFCVFLFFSSWNTFSSGEGQSLVELQTVRLAGSRFDFKIHSNC